MIHATTGRWSLGHWSTCRKVTTSVARTSIAPRARIQEKIYSQGRRYRPKDLVMRVTGKPMGAEDYLEGLRTKYQEVYAL